MFLDLTIDMSLRPLLNKFSRAILVGNLDLNKVPNDCSFLYFNPWGFSKSQIESQIEDSIKNSKISIDDRSEFFIYIKPLFFGKRGLIAYLKVKSLYPNNKVHFLDQQTIQSFLNDSAI
jgi:hypothetical protein